MSVRSNLIEVFFFDAWNNLPIRAITNSRTLAMTIRATKKAKTRVTPFPAPSNHKTFARLCRTPGCIKLNQPTFQHQPPPFRRVMCSSWTTLIPIHIIRHMHSHITSLKYKQWNIGLYDVKVSFQLLSYLLVYKTITR